MISYLKPSCGDRGIHTKLGQSVPADVTSLVVHCSFSPRCQTVWSRSDATAYWLFLVILRGFCFVLFLRFTVPGLCMAYLTSHKYTVVVVKVCCAGSSMCYQLRSLTRGSVPAEISHRKVFKWKTACDYMQCTNGVKENYYCAEIWVQVRH